MSSGGGKDTTVTQTSQFPPQFAPYAADLLGKGMATANQPYQAYQGQLIAPQSQYTQQGIGLQAQRGLLGSPTDQAAGQQAASTLSGQYLNYDPGQNQFLGQSTPVGQNQYIGQTTQVGQNPLMGANPYLEQNIQGTLGDMSRNYAIGTAAQTDAAASRARALGGSAYNELSGIQGGELAKQMGQVSSGMRMQDYTQQQALQENALNRGVSTQLADYARNIGAQQSQLGLQAQVGQTDIARNAGLAENQLGRGLQAYTTERENQMRALGLAPALQTMDYSNIGQVQAAGQAQDLYGQQQLDSQYQQWLLQQQYPYSQANFGIGLLGPLAGSQTQQTSPYSGTQAVTGALGGGMLGYGAGSALAGTSAMQGAAITPYAPWLGALVGAGAGYLASR